MKIFIDVLTGKELCSDSYPISKACDGAVMVLESKKVQVGEEEIDIGANPSTEDGGGDQGEGVDKTKATVINIAHNHNLQQMQMEKKEYKEFQKGYWKQLKNAIDKRRFSVLGFDDDYKAPSDKAVAKAAEKEAESKLSVDGKAKFAAVVAQLESFKKNFEALQLFIKNEVEANFSEFEFFIPDGCSLDNSMIIPARYVGEALAPSFYIFVDGVIEEKV